MTVLLVILGLIILSSVNPTARQLAEDTAPPLLIAGGLAILFVLYLVITAAALVVFYVAVT